MTEFRFHEMSYAEIGREFAQLQASRDRWRMFAIAEHKKSCNLDYELCVDYLDWEMARNNEQG